MLSKGRKNKIRDLLARLNPQDKPELLIDSLKDDISEVAAKDNGVSDLRRSLTILQQNILNKLEDLPDKASLEELKKKYLDTIAEVEIELRDLIKEQAKDIIKLDDKLSEEKPDELTPLKDDLEDLRRLILSHGGGSMNRQIKVNGVDVLKKYTDINLVGSITAAVDTTDKNVDITFASGTIGPGTINEIAYFNTTTTIASLPVVTFPSLTELSYVKGVTSVIQTQINGKQNTITLGTTAQYFRGDLSLDVIAFLTDSSNIWSFNAATPVSSNNLFIGVDAGLGNTSNTNIFVGLNAGNGATTTGGGIFIGENAGQGAINAGASMFLGRDAGHDADAADASIFIGQNAGDGANRASASVFIGTTAGTDSTDAYASIFIGASAGAGAANAASSLFIGTNAGGFASNASFSIFIGDTAGNLATAASNSLFVGAQSGYLATNASYSTFIGIAAGGEATNANTSLFIGASSGYTATNAFESLFVGAGAGIAATNAAHSDFIGTFAGYHDTVNNTVSGYSLAIGKYSGTGGFTNGVSIGHGVTNSATNQLNLGNLIYGTGLDSVDTQTGVPMKGGSVGIGMVPTATPTFLGAEKITNGTFTGSAASWTLGTGWAYVTNTAKKNAAGTGTASQTSAAMVTPLVVGEYYTLVYTLSAFTGGGNITPTIGGVTLTAQTAAGTYSQDIQVISTADLVFTPSTSALRVTLDTVTLKKISGSGDFYVAGKATLGGVAISGHFTLPVGTTAALTAPIKFTMAGSALMTTKETGAMETDTDNVYLTKKTLIREAIPGVIFTQTADKSVTNTTTETSIVGTGVGLLTLPANFFVAGKTIRVTMSGVYSTVAVTGDIVTIKIKYGSTVLASKATTALVTSATNLYWESEVLVICRTTGATGTVQVSGAVKYQIAGSVVVIDELNNGVATTTLDTTASGLFDVTVTHGTADASNTVKSLISSFEVLN